MKRSFQKSEKLISFECDLDSFDVLLNDLLNNFEDENRTVKISTSLKDQDMEFESIEDLRLFQNELPNQIINITVHISNYSSSVYKSCRLSSNERSFYISVDSDNLAWSAGLIETVKSFSNNHRKWYCKLKGWHILLLSIAFIMHAPLLETLGIEEIPSHATKSLYFVAAILWLISFNFEKVFPPFKLSIHKKESWVKRNSTEIMVGATLLGAAAAIASAIVSVYQ